MPRYDLIIPYSGSWRDAPCSASVDAHSANSGKILVDGDEGTLSALNRGLEVSTAPFVVLLSPRVAVVPDWLERLNVPFQRYVSCGFSGPRTTDRKCWQGREPFGIRFRMLHREGPGLGTFCMMIRRQVFERLGVTDGVTQRWFSALVTDLVIPYQAPEGESGGFEAPGNPFAGAETPLESIFRDGVEVL